MSNRLLLTPIFMETRRWTAVKELQFEENSRWAFSSGKRGRKTSRTATCLHEETFHLDNSRPPWRPHDGHRHGSIRPQSGGKSGTGYPCPTSRSYCYIPREEQHWRHSESRSHSRNARGSSGCSSFKSSNSPDSALERLPIALKPVEIRFNDVSSFQSYHSTNRDQCFEDYVAKSIAKNAKLIFGADAS